MHAGSPAAAIGSPYSAIRLLRLTGCTFSGFWSEIRTTPTLVSCADTGPIAAAHQTSAAHRVHIQAFMSIALANCLRD
jgi:hypothetical protein